VNVFVCLKLKVFLLSHNMSVYLIMTHAKAFSIGGSTFCIWKALQLTKGSADKLVGWSEARKLTSLATTSIQMSFFLQSK
jgi:hypothetical protein